MPKRKSLNEHPRERRFNAFKHGCCSQTPVLPGEDEALWREVEGEWFDEYDPQTPIARTLVAAVALAFWNKRRCHLRVEESNLALSQKNAMDWTEEDHLKHSRFLRYETAADRHFTRSWKDVEYLMKNRITQEEAARRANHRVEELCLKSAKQDADLALAQNKHKLEERKQEAAERKQASADAHKDKDRDLQRELALQATRVAPKSAASASVSPAKISRNKKKKDGLDVVEQWVEIRITDGLTTTQYVPTNEELIEECEDDEIEPQMVYRRLNFPDGIPPEYGWTNMHSPSTCESALKGEWCPLCNVRERGGCGIQRMTYQTWRRIIRLEMARSGQHAGPTGLGNLPRPKERGGDLDYDELLALEQKWSDRVDSIDR